VLLIYLSRVATALASPFGAALALIVIAIFVRRGWLSRAASLVALLVLLICSLHATADIIAGSLEDRYPDTPVANLPNAQAIVVLGGGLEPPSGRHSEPELTEAGDRYVHAFALYRAAKAPLVVPSGGNLLGGPPESQFVAQLLIEWGVPASAILTEGRSRNTAENAAFTHDLLAARGVSKILLVTSATHMRRAAALFSKAGFEVIPSAADYRTGWHNRARLFDFVPDAAAIEETSAALKEYEGYADCRLSGKC
jgi:uncharacterized SAM-binding protein YcdF (DUF218 family)